MTKPRRRSSSGSYRKRLLRDCRGTTAVEFAFVAPIFFALVLSILEAGYFYVVNATITDASARASRLIRTGQAQQNSLTPQNFFDEICDVVQSLGSCDDLLTVDIASFADFAALAGDLSTAQCRSAADPSIQGAQFSNSDYGGRRQIVRVRVCFLYRPLNPGLGLSLTKNSDGFREIVSVSIFRNEPF